MTTNTSQSIERVLYVARFRRNFNSLRRQLDNPEYQEASWVHQWQIPERQTQLDSDTESPKS